MHAGGPGEGLGDVGEDVALRRGVVLAERDAGRRPAASRSARARLSVPRPGAYRSALIWRMPVGFCSDELTHSGYLRAGQTKARFELPPR